MLKATGISFAVGQKVLLHPTDVSFEQGHFHVIMGPNGAGKSTLVKLLSRELSSHTGEITLLNKNLKAYSPIELARLRAVLSQHYSINFPISADEIILMGRYPYFNLNPSAVDLAICEQAKQTMQIKELGERDFMTLSGGEAQKVQMSRVLAQIGEIKESEKKIVFLDEPVSHLDPKYQYQLLKVARQLCNSNVTVIAVLHDINLALSFADRLLLMRGGNIQYDLHDPQSITSIILKEVFDVDSEILYSTDQKPIVRVLV